MSKKSDPVIRDLFVPQFRTAYDGQSDFVSEQTSISFPEPSEEEFSALQSFRDECDINNIVADMERHKFDRFADRVAAGHYLDLASLPDFTDGMNIVVQAQAAFADLPAHIRKEFDNDPASFLAFVDKGDRAEFERLGLVPPQETPSPPENKQGSGGDGRQQGRKGSDEPEDQA